MLITKTSPLTGKTNTMDIPVTEEQLASWEVGGKLIQNAMPDLTAEQREFILTGYTPEDWEAMFGNEEEDPTPYCSACHAMDASDCDCGPIASNE